MLTLILRFGSSSSTSGFLVNYSRVVVILRVAVMGNSWDFHAEEQLSSAAVVQRRLSAG